MNTVIQSCCRRAVAKRRIIIEKENTWTVALHHFLPELLVAIQINQNTRITQAQILNDYYLADMQLELAMMGENPAESWVKAVYSPDDLSDLDRAVLDRYFNYGWVQVRRLREMREVGLAPQDLENQMGYLRWQLGNEIGRRWWKNNFDPSDSDLVSEVDAILAHSDYGGNERLLDSMKLTRDLAE